MALLWQFERRSSTSYAPGEHQRHLVSAGLPRGHSRGIPGENWAAQWAATVVVTDDPRSAKS